MTPDEFDAKWKSVELKERSAAQSKGSMDNIEDPYLATILNAVRVCAKYKPKMGQGAGDGVDLATFQSMYRADPFYSWFGLDNPLMYAAHKAAGGMTSVYRQIGIGCERLFRKILEDKLAIGPEESAWSYKVRVKRNKYRTLSLDGRIRLDAIADQARRQRVRDWLVHASDAVGVQPRIRDALVGAVFEVRQGYKSKDSKRQNADIGNAATAYSQAYLPCIAVFSTQIDDDVAARYRMVKWVLLVGSTSSPSPIESTYAFMREVVGFDLARFFETHADTLRGEIAAVLKALLSPQE